MYTRCFLMSRRFHRCRLHTRIYPVWIAGLALGFAAERFYGDVYSGFFELAPMCQPTFLGLAVVNVFPVLISAFAVWINSDLLCLLCLFRGMCLGLALCACGKIYGQAGGMMSGLMLFSLLAFSPVMLWYWSRAAGPAESSFRRDTAICIGIALIVAWADIGMIAPFLREVMIF